MSDLPPIQPATLKPGAMFRARFTRERSSTSVHGTTTRIIEILAAFEGEESRQDFEQAATEYGPTYLFDPSKCRKVPNRTGRSYARVSALALRGPRPSSSLPNFTARPTTKAERQWLGKRVTFACASARPIDGVTGSWRPHRLPISVVQGGEVISVRGDTLTVYCREAGGWWQVGTGFVEVDA